MSIFAGLQPAEVWNFFEEICQIPRPSKKEERMIAYLKAFGASRNLETRIDAAGNVLIVKPATPGMENRQIVVLQSHMDMVCEKNSDTVHDFDADPILPFIDKGWVKAKGTTLGGDDGIGIAAQLALLDSKTIPHGKIECLFTVDEETGLTGAFELREGFFEGKILLNLDSEDEGELFIGCAGGIDTTVSLPYRPEEVPAGMKAFWVKVYGLKGGHSGDDIDKGLGNSNKILNRFLWNAQEKFGIRIGSFQGGNLRNAIPREAEAVFCASPANEDAIRAYFTEYSLIVRAELAQTEPGLNLELAPSEKPVTLMDVPTQAALLNALYACPHGVIAMSRVIPGLVETSTNLAAVKFRENHTVLITTSQRSSVDSSKTDIASMVESVFRLTGAEISHGDGYPGWAPNADSAILRITEEAYLRLFGNKPVVRAIHAGLECGLFLEKYPDLDMISFGPTIRGAHSPDERMEIDSVTKFWDLLIEVLKETPKI